MSYFPIHPVVLPRVPSGSKINHITTTNEMAFLKCEVSVTSELAQQVEEWSFKVVVGFHVVFKGIELLAIFPDKVFGPFGLDFRFRAEGVDGADYFWKIRLLLWR